MSRHMFRQWGMCLALVFGALAGCRSDLPGEAMSTTTGLSDTQVLSVLQDRADQVKRVMASGTMQVTKQDGDSIRMEIALLASEDDRLRLRAWKLGRAVFDLTRDGEDLWIWHAEQDANTQVQTDSRMPLTADHLSTAWLLLSGRVFASAPQQLVTEGPLVAVYPITDPQGGQAVARLSIDRDTQTVTAVTIHDQQGNQRAVFKASRYRMIDDIAWATNVELVSEVFSFEITLDDVAFNGELPASAFSPPRGARILR